MDTYNAKATNTIDEKDPEIIRVDYVARKVYLYMHFDECKLTKEMNSTRLLTVLSLKTLCSVSGTDVLRSFDVASGHGRVIAYKWINEIVHFIKNHKVDVSGKFIISERGTVSATDCHMYVHEKTEEGMDDL